MRMQINVQMGSSHHKNPASWLLQGHNSRSGHEGESTLKFQSLPSNISGVKLN